MLRAQHIVLRENGSFFIGWHATDTETARTLLGGGRYVPPKRTGYLSGSDVIIRMEKKGDRRIQFAVLKWEKEGSSYHSEKTIQIQWNTELFVTRPVCYQWRGSRFPRPIFFYFRQKLLVCSVEDLVLD